MRWPQKGRMSNRSADGPHHIVVEKVGEGRRVANRQDGKTPTGLIGPLVPTSECRLYCDSLTRLR